MKKRLAIEYIDRIVDEGHRECAKRLYLNGELCEEHIKDFDSSIFFNPKSCAVCLENYELDTTKIACRNCHHGIQDNHTNKILCCYYPFSITKERYNRCSFFYHKDPNYREE